MDCEKVRERFSSLWDKEISPFDEKIIREHLSSCPGCRKEFDQFEKTMRWLHSVKDVEVPDGFLPGLYEKLEERKEMISAEKSRKKWLGLPLPLKLPVQAVAMVAVIFFVLYLTKMLPMRYSLKEVGQPLSTVSLEKRPEGVPAQEEMKRERASLKTAPGALRPKDVEQAKAPFPEEKKLEPTLPQMKARTKRAEAPSPENEVLALKQVRSEDAAKAAAPSPGPEKIEKESLAEKKPVAAAGPAQEIVVKTSDREKAISQLYRLAKQFGGEIVTAEGDTFVASLPAGSLPQFEKELSGLSSSTEADRAIIRKPAAGGARAVQEVKKEVVEGRMKEPAELATDERNRTIVRILLVHE